MKSKPLTKKDVWNTFFTDEEGNSEDLFLFKKDDVLSAKEWLKKELEILIDGNLNKIVLSQKIDEAFNIGDKEWLL